MMVDEVDFKRASKRVSDSFKIPWLYSIEALLKERTYLQVFQPGTALIFRTVQIVADELLFSSVCTLCRLCLRMAKLVRARRLDYIDGKE